MGKWGWPLDWKCVTEQQWKQNENYECFGDIKLGACVWPLELKKKNSIYVLCAASSISIPHL